MITAPLPTNPILRKKIWNLWATHKEELKSDGFRVKKYNDTWSIAYFQDVNDESYERVDSEPLYMKVFKEVFAKWQKVHETISDVPPRPSKKDDDEENELWFVDF